MSRYTTGEALSSIPIENLRTYLASAGWQIRGQWGGRPAAIFARESRARTWEITVPYNDAVAGYAEGMAEAVKVLSTVEERSQLDVLHDLASTQVGDAGRDVAESVSDEGKYRRRVGRNLCRGRSGPRYLKAAPHAETLYGVTLRTLRSWIREESDESDDSGLPVTFDDLIEMRVIAALRSAGLRRSEVFDAESLMLEDTEVRRPMASETLWAGQSAAFSKFCQRLNDSGDSCHCSGGLSQKMRKFTGPLSRVDFQGH